MQISRRCKCGCGKITNPGKKWISGHSPSWNKGTGKIKIRRRCKCGCGSITNPGKIWIKGHHSFGNTNSKDKNHSIKSRQKMSISKIKCHPDDQYCDIWRDKEYKKDLRKDYCENINCRGDYKRLNNHHIDLDKKNCHPSNVMTLCVSCHRFLHLKLQDGKQIAINPKDFLIINRKDHVCYINKKTRKKITINLKNTIKRRI